MATFAAGKSDAFSAPIATHLASCPSLPSGRRRRRGEGRSVWVSPNGEERCQRRCEGVARVLQNRAFLWTKTQDTPNYDGKAPGDLSWPTTLMSSTARTLGSSAWPMRRTTCTRRSLVLSPTTSSRSRTVPEN